MVGKYIHSTFFFFWRKGGLASLQGIGCVHQSAYSKPHWQGKRIDKFQNAKACVLRFYQTILTHEAKKEKGGTYAQS